MATTIGQASQSASYSETPAPGQGSSLTPSEPREVLRCVNCGLNQYRPTFDTCRRCHLGVFGEPEAAAASPPTLMAPQMPVRFTLAKSIRSLRLRSRLSQRQLAMRMRTPRTYVSKIENEKATPTLLSLARLARALEVSLPELVGGLEEDWQRDVIELLKDPFVAEIVPFVRQLSGAQMAVIVAQMRDRRGAQRPA
jgi:transcriptional regulator with XRE-family HTH domain